MRSIQLLMLALVLCCSCSDNGTDELDIQQEALRNSKQVQSKNGPDVGHGFISDNPVTARELADLKRAVANIHTRDQVISSGWDAPLTGYVPNMGYHYGNWDLINDGVFDPGHPEAILVACSPSGELVAVAAEYLVLREDLEDPNTPPEGFTGDDDQWMIVGPFWTLHAWIKKPNPAGIFNPTNTEVATTDECSGD